MIIGICGKSGSGKSTLAKEIVNKYEHAIHLDIDKIGHRVLEIESVKEQLVNYFGKELLNNKVIDRKKLGKIVFASQNEMNKLSEITWKYMQQEIDNIINEHIDGITILDWLLLPITKYFSVCDIKILMDIPYDIRKDRALKRDNITEEDFYLREQASIEFNSNEFDLVIKNNEDKIRKLVMNI